MVRSSRRKRFAWCVWVSLAAALAQGGCSSTHTASGPTPCSVDPTPPSTDPFCTALAAYDGRCGHCSDCTAQNLQNCTKLASTVSDAYRAAFVTCKNEAGCDSPPSFSACVEQRLASATPTAGQAQAKTAYCNACSATNASDCDRFFSDKNAPGYNVLVYSDEVAMMAVGTCATDCDPFKYAVCVALLSCGPSGGDFCSDGGLCAPQ